MLLGVSHKGELCSTDGWWVKEVSGVCVPGSSLIDGHITQPVIHIWSDLFMIRYVLNVID